MFSRKRQLFYRVYKKLLYQSFHEQVTVNFLLDNNNNKYINDNAIMTNSSLEKAKKIAACKAIDEHVKVRKVF